MYRLLVMLCVGLALASCGSSKPTSPQDPNAGMYGAWNGTLNVTWLDGARTQDGISIALSRGAVAFYMSGAQYPATLSAINDPGVGFTVNIFGYHSIFTGTRSGGTLQGYMSLPEVGANGSWATTRAPATAAYRGPGMADMLERR